MNYQKLGMSITSAVAGLMLWYAPGYYGIDSMPHHVAKSVWRNGLVAIVQDAECTSSWPGAFGRMFTYAGMTVMPISIFMPGKKDKKKE